MSALKCPQCGEDLKAQVHGYVDMVLEHDDYMDIDFECPNGHTYFSRIETDDLMDIPKIR